MNKYLILLSLFISSLSLAVSTHEEWGEQKDTRDNFSSLRCHLQSFKKHGILPGKFVSNIEGNQSIPCSETDLLDYICVNVVNIASFTSVKPIFQVIDALVCDGTVGFINMAI